MSLEGMIGQVVTGHSTSTDTKGRILYVTILLEDGLEVNITPDSHYSDITATLDITERD